MKLADWAKKQGIAYLTAYRWFKDGKLPVKAYQSDSGTIIVQDELETSEQTMGTTQSNDVMTTILKKTVEFSKSNATIEDFAAWILSNFSLRFSNNLDSPRYSKVKPKSEEVQKHFQQFLKPKGEKPKPHMFVADPEELEEIAEKEGWSLETYESNHSVVAPSIDTTKISTVSITDIPELNQSINDLFSHTPISSVTMYDSVAEGVVNRSVEETPQLNYTGSNNLAPSNYSFNTATSGLGYMPPVTHTAGPYGSASYFVGAVPSVTVGCSQPITVFTNTFKPTQKELESASKVLEVVEKPKRGRKPSKNSRKV